MSQFSSNKRFHVLDKKFCILSVENRKTTEQLYNVSDRQELMQYVLLDLVTKVYFRNKASLLFVQFYAIDSASVE